uniref:DNA/RNA non-specific endonuclease domain-containing protein n=1 Tax=Phlebotomus papatasi TaxID=29031 RepID=A0A1B0DCX5_PHLPP
HVKQERGNFRSTKGIYGRVKINQLYITHISRFKRIFGQSQKFFRKPLHYLARGHLSPEVDFVFGTEQHATELYINTAPQFQSINQGNWLRVERHVRNLAKALQDNLSVVTGILGILRLSNKKATQDIYLSDDNVIPVPNIFWKAVFYPKTNSAIVFVGSNNPHSDKFEPMCKDICDKAGFGDKQHKNQNFSDHTVGNVICCQLSEFEVEPLLEERIWLGMNVLTNEDGQLLGILTNGWNLDIPTPIVIEMGHFVCPNLDFISRKARLIVNDVVTGGSNCALARTLGHNEEIIAFGKGDDIVNDSSRRWILDFVPSIDLLEDTRIDPLGHNDISKFWGSLPICLLQIINELPDFKFHHMTEITLANTIAIEYDATWRFLVNLLVLL